MVICTRVSQCVHGMIQNPANPGPDPDPVLGPRGEVDVINWCGRKYRLKFCNVCRAIEVEAPGLAVLPTGSYSRM